MRRSWLRQHNGLLLLLRACTVAPHQGASAATKQMCPHRSSMSEVIAPPGREGAWA